MPLLLKALEGARTAVGDGERWDRGRGGQSRADPLSPLAVAFEVELGYEVGRKICNLYDRKGILFVNWAERPSVQDIAAVAAAWGRYESDPIVYHYENGVELVSCAEKRNPFGASDQHHLAAIEHLRTARDLLKKTTKRMKQNGTEPNSVKRLFQAIKLTESALRHARRSQLKKEPRLVIEA